MSSNKIQATTGCGSISSMQSISALPCTYQYAFGTSQKAPNLASLSMPGWTVADIKNELGCISKLLLARPGVFELEGKLCGALKHKLSLMAPMGPSDLVFCYEAVRESQLPDTMKGELTQVLDSLALQEASQEHLLATATMAQECVSFQKYLTASDIKSLKSASMWEGCTTLATRMKLLGISSMKEGIKKTACSILVLFAKDRTNTIPPGDAVYSLSHHLYETLQSLPVEIPAGAVRLAVYPDDPSLLGTDHLAASYTGEKAEKMEFPGLSTIKKKHTPIRNTHSLVVKDPQLFFGNILFAKVSGQHHCSVLYAWLSSIYAFTSTGQASWSTWPSSYTKCAPECFGGCHDSFCKLCYQSSWERGT